MGILHGDRSGFDCDSPCPLKFHIVEHLLIKLAQLDRAGRLQTGDSARVLFSMIDMSKRWKSCECVYSLAWHVCLPCIKISRATFR